jgi:hypothetical protein
MILAFKNDFNNLKNRIGPVFILLLCIAVQMNSDLDSITCNKTLADLIFVQMNDINIFGFSIMFVSFILADCGRSQDMGYGISYCLVFAFIVSLLFMLMIVSADVMVLLVSKFDLSVLRIDYSAFSAANCLREVITSLVLQILRTAFRLSLFRFLTLLKRGWISFILSFLTTMADYYVSVFDFSGSHFYMLNNTVSNQIFTTGARTSSEIIICLLYWAVLFAVLYITGYLFLRRAEKRSIINRSTGKGTVITRYLLVCIFMILSGVISFYINKSMISDRIRTGDEMFYYSFVSGNNILNTMFPVTCVVVNTNRTGKNSLSDALKRSSFVLISHIASFVMYYCICIIKRGSFHVEPELTGTLGVMTEIFKINYLLIFIVNSLLLCLTYSMLSYALYKENKIGFLVYPMVIYHLYMYSIVSFNNHFLDSMIPLSAFNLTMISRDPWAHLISIMIILIAAAAAIKFRGKKDRYVNSQE